jgi:hypothetical protein
MPMILREKDDLLIVYISGTFVLGRYQIIFLKGFRIDQNIVYIS